MLTECRKRQQITPNCAWTASLCSIYCCLVYLVYLFLPFHFSEVETASEMKKKHVRMCVLLTHVSKYRICELTITVHSVTESKQIYKSLENIVVCHFDMLENAHF